LCHAHARSTQAAPGVVTTTIKKLGKTDWQLHREMVNVLFERKKHPEQAYRACLGLLNLSKQYTPIRLEAACQRALHINAPQLKNIKSILKSNMDQLPPPINSPSVNTERLTESHQNVRGSDYFH
jgi:hypothetical protein